MSNVKLAQKMVALQQAADPKSGILDEIADSIDQFEMFNDDVLIAIYAPKENMKDGMRVTDGGIFIPQNKTEKDAMEHVFQGKVGLVLKKGPIAFKYDRAGCAFEGRCPDDHEWVLFRPSDGWSVSFNGVSCRVINSTSIRGIVGNPSAVW